MRGDQVLVQVEEIEHGLLDAGDPLDEEPAAHLRGHHELLEPAA